jgi:signal transduction histidine kinase
LYTVEGGVTITISTKDNYIIIQVKDTGVGIEKEDFDKIFKSFSRGKGSAELYTQGTGLGLYVAKSFVEMHNGKLSVESEGKNKGSTFTFELPIQGVIKSQHDFKLVEEQ